VDSAAEETSSAPLSISSNSECACIYSTSFVSALIWQRYVKTPDQYATRTGTSRKRLRARDYAMGMYKHTN